MRQIHTLGSASIPYGFNILSLTKDADGGGGGGGYKSRDENADVSDNDGTALGSYAEAYLK